MECAAASCCPPRDLLSRHGPGAKPLAADAFHLYRRETGEAERPGAGRREVDHPSAHERAAIVDAHDHAAAVARVGDAHARAERQLSLIHISEPTRRTPISYAV